MSSSGVALELELLWQGWKTAGPVAVVASTVVGALLGMLVSFMVICSLVEISLSFFEAVMFGIVLTFVGGFMIWRATSMHEGQPKPCFRVMMGGFGVAVGVAGVCCFGLQEGWGTSMSTQAKIPIYFLLGTTLSFSVIFGFGEIVNLCVAHCVSEETRPVFNSSKQIMILVVLTSIMGAIEGLVFGSLDAEDDVYLRKQFPETNKVCIPLGACVGALMGFLNESLRNQPDQSNEAVGKDRTDPYQTI
jgi:uncharacterized protein YacL